MSLFRRGTARRSSDDRNSATRDFGTDATDASATTGATTGATTEVAAAERNADLDDRPTRADGPWDLSEIPDPAAGGRVNLGGMWVPALDGLEIRVEADPETRMVTSVTLVLGDSALQAQPFAAPRSGGLWAEIRTDMAAGLTQQGGTADTKEGPLGPELHARVPVSRPDGSSGLESARFVGVDGPRWFLRGALTGRAATDPTAGKKLLRVFQDIVVVRGSTPMAPREPLPLMLPEAASPATGVAEAVGAAEGGANALAPFERGPEITEVR